MKILQSALLLLTIFAMLSSTFEKVHKRGHKKQLPIHVHAQYGRNYIHPWPDPSMNPLPREYYTGPVTNFAPITNSKYLGYQRYLANTNNYRDMTHVDLAKGHGHESARLGESHLLRHNGAAKVRANGHFGL